MSDKTAKSQKNVSAAAVMPKPKDEPAPVVAPEVDVLERKIPPETSEITYELLRWIDDSSDESLYVDHLEYHLMRGLVRLMRSGGWMGEFLGEIVNKDSYACRHKPESRLSPDQVRQILANKSREAEAA